MENIEINKHDKNHKLARGIDNADWHGFIMKLEYKAQAAGRHLIKLEQWFASSKPFSDCGHKMPDMPLQQRLWAYPACGASHDRDINAAMNIEPQGILELKGSATRRFYPFKTSVNLPIR